MEDGPAHGGEFDRVFVGENELSHSDAVGFLDQSSSDDEGEVESDGTPHRSTHHAKAWAADTAPEASASHTDPEETGVLFYAGYDTEGLQGGSCPENPSALGCSGKWIQKDDTDGDSSNPTLSVSADGIPTSSRCATECPACKTNPHNNQQPPECGDCKEAGKCWPGHNLTDTTDHTCDCLATLSYCAEGVEPVLKPGDKCPSCWPVDNVACACFGALGFCEH